MPGAKRVASEEETLAPRINSGHLSDQFQRELSSNGDDLLQAELTIDDINSASGSGVSPYSSLNTTPLSSPSRPNMLPSNSTNTWQPPVTYSASPFAAFSGAPGTTSNLTSPQDARLSNGQGASSTGRGGGATASSALTQAYRQPSKIPRLASASSIGPQSALPARQGSRAMDRKLSQGTARTASGAMRKNSAALPSVSKPKPPKAPARSPSQSLSDTSEDTTLPAWKLATRVPPSKYSQQREKALGGPFDRSSSTSIPKPAKGKGKSAAQPYTGSSSKAAQDMQRYRREHGRNNGRLQDPQLAVDTLSSMPILAQPASPPTETQAPEPQLAEAQLAEASPQAVDNGAEDAAAAVQQPAEGVLLHQNGMSEVTGNVQDVQTGQIKAEEATHLNGSQHPDGDVQLDSNHQEPAAQVHDLGSDGQKAISPDQVGIEVKVEHMPAETSAQHSQPAVASHTISEADEAKLAKKAKCCGCTIM